MYLHCDTIRVIVGEHYNCDDIQKLVLACYMAYNFLKRACYYCVETEDAVSK